MALLDGLHQRIDAKARAVAERARQAVEASWKQFPDIMIRRQGETLILSGRGLLSRWLGDVRLRFSYWSPR